MSISVLSHRLGGLDRRELLRFVVRVSVAAIPAALLAAGALTGLEALGLDLSSRRDSFVLLVTGGVVGLVVYALISRLLHINEVGRVVALITRRGRPRSRTQTI